MILRFWCHVLRPQEVLLWVLVGGQTLAPIRLVRRSRSSLKNGLGLSRIPFTDGARPKTSSGRAAKMAAGRVFIALLFVVHSALCDEKVRGGRQLGMEIRDKLILIC